MKLLSQHVMVVDRGRRTRIAFKALADVASKAVTLAITVAAQYPDLTILLMTGFADQRERAHGLEALIYDVVPKPFSLQVLLEKVDDALRGKPLEITSMAKAAMG